MTQRIVTVGDDLLLPRAVKKVVSPAIVFGYDDGVTSISTIGQSIFANEGIAATAFVNAARIGTPGFMSWAQVEAIADHYYSTGTGFEIQCHENDHNYFNPTTRAQVAALATSIETGLATFRAHGIIADYLAYPGHLLNKRGQEIARRYYKGARRSPGPTINTIDNLDPYAWTTGLSDGMKLTKAEDITSSFEARLEQLNANPGIMVTVHHSFEPGYAATNTAEQIQSAITMAKAAGVRIISFSQANQELRLASPRSVPIA